MRSKPELRAAAVAPIGLIGFGRSIRVLAARHGDTV
jgi:hypothetical protein